MGISLILSVFAGVSLVFMFSSDNFPAKLIACMLMCGSISYCTLGDLPQKQRKIEEIQSQKREEACRRPEFVSEIGSVRLYKYSKYCGDSEPVYFSSSGTQTEHCRHVGKQIVCEEFRVPNTVKD